MNSIRNYSRFYGGNPFAAQAKLLHHLDRIMEYRETGDTRPILCEVNLTNRCNLRCKWCISENFRGGESLTFDVARRFLREFAELGGKAVTFSGGGEPTMHWDFVQLTHTAKEAGLDLGLMTNGAFNDGLVPVIGENFSWARISLDTVDSRVYEHWKGFDHVHRILANLEALRPYPVKVGVNCNVGHDMTTTDVQRLILTVHKDADYLQFRPILPRHFRGEEPEINWEVWDYLADLNGDTAIPLNLSDDKLEDLSEGNFFPFRKCRAHRFNPVLNADGNLRTCMYHPRDSRFDFGNIYDTSLAGIWASEQRQKTIRFVEGLDYAANCQICCKLTEQNRFLDFLDDTQAVPDVHFL